MDKVELNAIKTARTYGAVEDTDLLFGYNGAVGRYGFFPATALTGNSYACRRWNLDLSTPVGER